MHFFVYDNTKVCVRSVVIHWYGELAQLAYLLERYRIKKQVVLVETTEISIPGLKSHNTINPKLKVPCYVGTSTSRYKSSYVAKMENRGPQ